MEGGWLKLYRCLINKPIWQCTTPEQKAILITLLCMANHEEKEWIWQGKKYKCKPGQFITSLKSIAEKSGTSIKNVRTALKNFEQIYEFSASISTNKNRLITITNWELYQSKEGKVASRTASKRQATGKQVATNKNDKNDKKYKDNTREIENFRQRYSDFIDLVDEYFEILRTTRVSGKISDSVVYKVYEEMNKYPPIVVKYACQTIINNPQLHDKKENYFFGIMRNTTAEEANRKLNKVIEMPKSKYRDLTNYEPGGENV